MDRSRNILLREIQIYDDFPLNAELFGAINWMYKGTMLLFVVEMSEVEAAVNTAEGRLKDALNINYHT